jgi:hypothetical protein
MPSLTRVLVGLCLASAAALVPAPALAKKNPPPTTNTVSLADGWSSYPNGVNVYHWDQQVRTFVGAIFPFGYSGGDSEWGISQWHGAYPFTFPMIPRTGNGEVEYSTAGKRLVFGPGNRLVLGVNSIDRALHTNTGKKEKTQFGIARKIGVRGAEFYRLTDLAALKLTVTARLTKADVASGGLQAGAAQSFISMHVRNIATDGPAADDLIYFVGGLYDNRYPKGKPETVNLDGASLNRFFIYNTGTAALAGKGNSFSDQQWHTIEVDLLPLIKKGLSAAWKASRKKDVVAKFTSFDLHEYTVSHLGINWEMSENMNVEMEFKDFHLDAAVISTAPQLVISAEPMQVAPGGTANIMWSSRNLSACKVTGPGFSSSGVSGSFQTVSLQETSIYKVTCGTESRSVTIEVPPTGCGLTSSPGGVPFGQSTLLSWNTRGDFEESSLYPFLQDFDSATNSLQVWPPVTTKYFLTLWLGTVLAPGGERERFVQCQTVVPVNENARLLPQ